MHIAVNSLAIDESCIAQEAEFIGVLDAHWLPWLWVSRGLDGESFVESYGSFQAQCVVGISVFGLQAKNFDALEDESGLVDSAFGFSRRPLLQLDFHFPLYHTRLVSNYDG